MHFGLSFSLLLGDDVGLVTPIKLCPLTHSVTHASWRLVSARRWWLCEASGQFQTIFAHLSAIINIHQREYEYGVSIRVSQAQA